MTLKLTLLLSVFLALNGFLGAATIVGTNGALSASVEISSCGVECASFTLTNTGLDALAPSDLLTWLVFSYDSPTITFTPVSVTLSPGSTVVFPVSGTGTDPGGVVGGEFGFSSDMAGYPGSFAVSSAGWITNWVIFPGTNLDGPVSPDGPQYGIASMSDNPLTGNSVVTGSTPFIRGGAIFVFGVDQNFDPNLITVRFQYGTSLSEPNFPGIEASDTLSAFLVGSGLLLLLIGRKRQASIV